jgi:hypothetical protein
LTSGLEELSKLLAEKGRRIIVAENPVDLKSLEGNNSIYVLQLPDESHSAGGRIGGLGERRLVKVYYFHYQNGVCRKVYETDDETKISRFELPYHAAGLPVVLPDGSTKVVSGVVDPDFVVAYQQVT